MISATAVQKIVDVLIERDARDELTRLTHRLERLRFRAERGTRHEARRSSVSRSQNGGLAHE
jgi:hypothetical protein